MSDVVIKIENLYKEYKLGSINHGTLTHDLQSWWARMRGKEDPNSLISVHHNADAEKDSFLALKDINFEVKAGDRVGIIGKNGAGKSTLLKILSRITSPTMGLVKIKGRVGSLLEVGTGFHPELTGRENIYLNGAILGMSKKEIDRKLDEIVDFAGIEKHIDTPVKRYSSGMNVRLGFAVAAHLEPEILIIDEVLAVGDAEFQKKAIGKMEEVSRGEGRTILFVSHNMGAIQKLCSNCILISKGTIEIYENNVDNVIKQYTRGSKQKNKTNGWNKNGEKEMSNEYFTLNRMAITNENGNTIEGPIKNDVDFFLNIEFDLHHEDRAFQIGFAMYNNDEELLFWSFNSDDEENKWPKIIVGKNIIRVKFNKNLLNEGEYSIIMLASLYNRKWILKPGEPNPSISFEISGGLSKSPYWCLRRPGRLAPIFKWEKIN